MWTAGLFEFLVDVLLALATLVGTAALLWVWFHWVAAWAMRETGTDLAPRVRGLHDLPSGPDTRGDSDPSAPSASPAARAEIAELEALWKLSRGRSDPP